MSSILKALKKLEKEKLVQQEPLGVNVSSEILRQQPENRKVVLWLWIAGVTALAIIATLTALLLTKPPLQKVAAPGPAAALPPTEITLPPAAGTVMTSPPVNTGGKTVTAPLFAPADSNRQQSRPEVPPPLPSAARSSSTEMPASNVSAQDTPRAEPGRKPLPATAPEQTESPLTLSGIAWNKDSSDRLAIINGQPTATGATVSGVVVEEIMPDRVRVNSAGRSFEIFLGKAAKSN